MSVNKVMTQNRKQDLIRNKQKNQLYLNLEKKGEWDKNWVVSWVFFLFIHFISLNRYLHIFICMYMSMYEYSYFDYIAFHVHIEKEKSYNYCLVVVLLQKLKFRQS